jgi:DNA polymerase-1
MIAVQHWLDESKKKSLLIMQVHDELVLEVPEQELAEAKEKVSDLMQGVASLSVPLIVEVGTGDNWDQAH